MQPNQPHQKIRQQAQAQKNLQVRRLTSIIIY